MLTLKYSKRKLLRYYFYLILVLIGIKSQNLLNISYSLLDMLIAFFVFVSLYYKDGILKTGKIQSRKYFCHIFISGWIVILVYSLFIQLIQALPLDYLTHTITLSIRIVLYILFAILSYDLFGNDIVPILLAGLVCAYIPSLILFFMKNGLLRGIVLLFSSDSLLSGDYEVEVHGLTYMFGMIAVYYAFILFNAHNIVSNAKRYLCISLILMFIGLKRIEYVAVVISMLLIILFRMLGTKRKLNKHTVKIILAGGSIAMVVIAYIYVLLVHDGMFQYITTQRGINVSGRYKLWNYICGKFQMGIGYFGKGISYSHRLMQNEYMNIRNLNRIVDIHNDIVAVYAGLGCIGSFAYWLWFFWYKCKTLLKQSRSSAVFAFILSVHYFVEIMVSNGGLRQDRNFVYALLIISAHHLFIQHNRS